MVLSYDLEGFNGIITLVNSNKMPESASARKRVLSHENISYLRLTLSRVLLGIIRNRAKRARVDASQGPTRREGLHSEGRGL